MDEGEVVEDEPGAEGGAWGAWLGPTFPLDRQGPLLVAGALEGEEREEREERRNGKEVVKW